MIAVITGLVISTLIGAFWLAGLKFWAGFWVGLLALLATIELISKLMTGYTLSQSFWRFRQRRPKVAWALTAWLAVGWIGLLIHLNWR